MFALRDIGGMEAVEGLASALRDESALLRHEIGFVFGQLQDPESAPAIIKALRVIIVCVKGEASLFYLFI